MRFLPSFPLAAREYVAAHFGDTAGENLDQIRRFSVDYLRKEQDIDLNAFGVKFDSYFLESSLYADGRVAPGAHGRLMTPERSHP